MIRKFLLIGFASLSVFLISCKSDDDSVTLLTTEEQNTADDTSIVNFLNSYYFDDLGKIAKFSETVTSNDKDPLSKNAVKDPSGFWYAINPSASSGTGDTPDGQNNILIHYNLKYYIATEGGGGYSVLTNSSSTIDNLGVPQQNPSFYQKPKTDSTHAEDYYIIKGFVNGLKKFKPTNKEKNVPYDKLQGVIIVPSRLAYARNSNYMGISNATFILNFELYKVCPKDEACE